MHGSKRVAVSTAFYTSHLEHNKLLHITHGSGTTHNTWEYRTFFSNASSAIKFDIDILFVPPAMVPQDGQNHHVFSNEGFGTNWPANDGEVLRLFKQDEKEAHPMFIK